MENLDIKISVIVPIYNVEQYLSRCIESIISQTYKNLEIILIDDGSTDSSGDICDKYKKRDDRIIVVRQSNSGLVRARKKGLQISTGEYVGFVDGDDYISNSMFERLLVKAIDTNADIVDSGFYIGDNKKNCNVIKINFDQTESIEENIRYYKFKNLTGDEIGSVIWSKLFKRKVILEAYNMVPDNQSMGEDVINLIACMANGASIVGIDEAYYYYTVRYESISHSDISKRFKDEVNIYEGIKKILQKKGLLDGLVSDFNAYYYRRLANVLEVARKSDFPIVIYKLPFIEKFYNKKLIIYGAGKVGTDYYVQLRMKKNIDIVAWTDARRLSIENEYMELVSLDDALNMDYDYIIIANSKAVTIQEIRNDLVDRGVVRTKIVEFVPVLL